MSVASGTMRILQTLDTSMEVVYDDESLTEYMNAAVGVTPDRPILIALMVSTLSSGICTEGMMQAESPE